MNVIRRKISREDLISRNKDSYGSIVEPFIYIHFPLQQTIDNIGIYTNQPFIDNTTNEIDLSNILKGIRPNYEIKKWFKSGNIIKARTTSKLNDLKGYKDIDRYKIDFDIDKGEYFNYQGDKVDGVSRVISKEGDVVSYVIDAKKGPTIGTDHQSEGLLYIDNANDEVSELGDIRDSGNTEVQFKAQGINETNASLMAITKEEYLMGIISTPEIKNDVFIDRGRNTVMENHLRMSEVETLEHLVNYGNGYFNVKR